MEEGTILGPGGGDPVGTLSMGRGLVAVVSVTLVAVTAVAFAVWRSGTVVEMGRLLPYTDATIVDVALFGGRMYVEVGPISVIARLAAVFLLVGAGAAFVAWSVLHVTGSATASERRFYGLAGIGALVLACDGLFSLHATVGHNLGAVMAFDGPMTGPLAIEVALWVGGLGAFLWGRRALGTSSDPLRLWRAAALVAAAKSIVELLGGTSPEALVVVAAGLVAGGLLLAAVEAIRWAIEPRHRGRVRTALGDWSADRP